jgi:small GTP-binding protein
MMTSVTPRGERLHIGIFGKRNTGKSTLMNAITGQDVAVVSPVKGTTTDPVYKAMELLPVGAVVLIDTAGIDDEQGAGSLGQLRITKTREILRKTDVALLVTDSRGCSEFDPHERGLISAFDELGVRYMVVYNDFSDNFAATLDTLKTRITELSDVSDTHQPLISDLLTAGDIVVLVTPIDSSAPKGRLILPQQQVVRDVLEAGAFPILTQPAGLTSVLAALNAPPRIVITDSQAFGETESVLSPEIPLTSFSILFARYKGVLAESVRSVETLDALQDGDKILICEGCTHHRQCDDIGTVKLPRALRKHSGAELEFAFTSGGEFPQDLSDCRLVIHCGGCVLNRREMLFRQNTAKQANVPFTNYGVAFSRFQEILQRSTECL